MNIYKGAFKFDILKLFSGESLKKGDLFLGKERNVISDQIRAKKFTGKIF